MYSPSEVAMNYIATGKKKVNTPIEKLFVLGILAGLFIAAAAVGLNTATATIVSPSVAKIISSCIFPAGLAMVLVSGSELFTGNTLLIIPLLQKEVKISGVLRNWVIVYAGNFVGSVLFSIICVYGHQISLFDNQVAVVTIATAAGKTSLSFIDALMKGIGCNFLVCIAVWISYSSKDVAGKIIGLFFPIMLFIVSGFEHSVANMYYITAGLFAKGNDVYAAAATQAGIDMTNLTWGNLFIKNLIPVTLGNIIGGSILVGVFYWFVYLYKNPAFNGQNNKNK